jgi:RecA-family ATPase
VSVQFNPLPLAEFLKQEEDNTTSWLVHGFWKHGGYTLVSGLPKLARKSFFVERMALCIAGGISEKEIRPTKQGVVLYIAEEGPRIDAKDRLRAQCISLNLSEEELSKNFFVMHLSGFRLFLPEHLEQILAWSDEHKPVAVVLDPWSKVGPDDENDTASTLVCMQAVSELQRKGISVCIVAHTRKMNYQVKMDIDQEVRGSSALTGAYDTHVALRPKEEGLPIPMVVRNKNAEQKEWVLRWTMHKELNEVRQEEHLVACELDWSAKT